MTACPGSTVASLSFAATCSFAASESGAKIGTSSTTSSRAAGGTDASMLRSRR